MKRQRQLQILEPFAPLPARLSSMCRPAAVISVSAVQFPVSIGRAQIVHEFPSVAAIRNARAAARSSLNQ